MSNSNDRFRKWCKVCGDQAFSFNFSGLSCESCKIFFRRNASKEKTLQCIWRTETCQIDVETRKHCSKCRLKKCFKIGMQIVRFGSAAKDLIQFFMFNFFYFTFIITTKRQSKRGRPRRNSGSSGSGHLSNFETAAAAAAAAASSDHQSCSLLSAHIEQLFRSLQSSGKTEADEAEEAEEEAEDEAGDDGDEEEEDGSSFHTSSKVFHDYEAHCLSVIRRLHLLFGDQPDHKRSSAFSFATDLTSVFVSQVSQLGSVAQLAKSTFGFTALPLSDQVTLFRRAFPAILLLRSAYYYHPEEDAFAVQIKLSPPGHHRHHSTKSGGAPEGSRLAPLLVPLKLLYGHGGCSDDQEVMMMMLNYHRWLAGEVREAVGEDVVLRDLLALLLLFKCDINQSEISSEKAALLHTEVVSYQFFAYCHLLWHYLLTRNDEDEGEGEQLWAVQRRYDRLLELVAKISAFKSTAAGAVVKQIDLQAVEPILQEIYCLCDNQK